MVVDYLPQDPLCLRKLDSIVVDKVIIGITQVPLGKSLCFAYNDGTVEYRDRFTLQPMYNEVNLDRITSLLEVGFDQDGGSGCKCWSSLTCLSATVQLTRN